MQKKAAAQVFLKSNKEEGDKENQWKKKNCTCSEFNPTIYADNKTMNQIIRGLRIRLWCNVTFS